MSKIIMHVDLNAFFATAEELRDPSLATKPVLIGHTGRSGIVSTCNYVARKYGCHSGQPTFQALKCCPNAIVLPPDYHYYKILSNSFFAFLRTYTHLVEAASIDEAYIDMTVPLGKEKDPVAFCRKLQFDLRKQTGLSCSIGVAPTKWLAKMGSDMKKPMGLTFIRRKDIPTILYPLPIESFWGIGRKTAPRLRSIGIQTIGDLAKAVKEEDEPLKKEMGKFYFTIAEWISGRGSDEIELEPNDPKSIGCSETLMHDSSSFSEIAETIRSLAAEVSQRAQREKKVGKGITLQVKDTAFRLHSKAFLLEESTNNAAILEDVAGRLYRANYEGMPIRLVGITLTRLNNPKTETVQMSLWNYEEFEKKDETKLLIHELNRKMKEPNLMRMSEVKKKGKK